MCWCHCAGSMAETTKDFSAALVRHLAQAWPQLFVVRATGWAGSTRTTCATALARRPWRPGRRGRGRACRSRCRSAGTNWSSGGAHWTIGRAGAIGYRQSSLDGYAPQAWAGHGGAWFASVVKARRRARGRQAGAASGRQRLLHRRRRMPHVVFLFIERNGVGPCVQEHRASRGLARPPRRRPSAHVPRRCTAASTTRSSTQGHGPGCALVACP